MKIGVISDTHDDLKSIDDALEILEKENIDMIIHCGDAVAPFSVAKLAGKNALYVYGNNDGEIRGILNVSSQLGIKVESQPAFLEIADKKIAVLHGSGTPEKTERLINALAKSGEFDLILYGHTHIPVVKVIGKTLIVNPGEASGVLHGKRTVALVDMEKMKARIIEF